MTILIIGAGGQLGEELVGTLEDDHTVRGFTHDGLDITDGNQVQRTVHDIQPEAVVNCAAYTDVDGAEDEPGEAFAVNAVGVKSLADAARGVDARLVHISTDYVFGGNKSQPYTTDDCPDPINTYGTSKLAGEHFVLNDTRGTVLRTSGVYGGEPGKHDNFVNTILRRARERDELTVVDDQVLSPTWTRPIAEAVGEILGRDIRGLHHFTSEGECSWYEFARVVVEEMGLEEEVTPIDTESLDLKARRPSRSTLENTLDEDVRSIPSWRTMIRNFCEHYPANSAS